MDTYIHVLVCRAGRGVACTMQIPDTLDVILTSHSSWFWRQIFYWDLVHND